LWPRVVLVADLRISTPGKSDTPTGLTKSMSSCSRNDMEKSPSTSLTLLSKMGKSSSPNAMDKARRCRSTSTSVTPFEGGLNNGLLVVVVIGGSLWSLVIWSKIGKSSSPNEIWDKSRRRRSTSVIPWEGGLNKVLLVVVVVVIGG